MAKFHVRLKLQALELEIDGERADIPLITNVVEQQFKGLLVAPDAAADGQKQKVAETAATDASARGKAGRKGRSTRTSSEASTPIEFRHNSAKYGNPLQTWPVADKCIWLLYVIKDQAGTAEVSGAQLTATFNDQFKAAGRIHPPLLTRELAKAKGQNPAPVGEDKDRWYLTDEGERRAKELVQSVVGL